MGYTLSKGGNSIADYAMQWNLLSQDGQRVGRRKGTWCRTVEKSWEELNRI